MVNNALRKRQLYKKKLVQFTGKELDAETGLYYYGARYLDPKTSRWLSGDPALGEYLPVAPVNDEAKKRNQNLPGQGGVFNYVNLHAYHYAGNNPVKYVDPDGRESLDDIFDIIDKSIVVVKGVEEFISDLHKPEARTVEGLYRINQKAEELKNTIIKNGEYIINDIKSSPVMSALAACLAVGALALDNELGLYNCLLSKGFDVFSLTYKFTADIGTNGLLDSKLSFSFKKEDFSFNTENIFSFNLSPYTSINTNFSLGYTTSGSTEKTTLKMANASLSIFYTFKR
jgi:RHS repeat-associated protein